MDINKNQTPQGASGHTWSNREIPPSATGFRRDVRAHSGSLRSVGECHNNHGNVQPRRAYQPVGDVLPVVRDGMTGCIATGRRNSPLYQDLLKKIKEQLAGPASAESLQEVDRLYNKILNECDYSTEELNELNYYKAKIAEHFFSHLEKLKSTLINELHFCFSIHSSGGADVLFEQFGNNVKCLHSHFSPVMQEILYDVGLIILSSQFDQNRISWLMDQLCQNNSSDSSLSELSHAESGELTECLHTARQIVRRRGKHKPVVLENYLDRLTTILGRRLALAESNRQQHLQALSLIVTEMTGTIEMNTGSDPDLFWHRMLFDAVLDVRFPSEFMKTYQDIISKKALQNWGLEELLGFITVIRSTGSSLGFCSAEFLSLLAKMDDQDHDQPTRNRKPAPASEDPEDRAVEHDEDISPEVFTEEDRRKELDIFLQVVALEVSGNFYHGHYDKHYSDWHVLVETILGKRALVSPDSRQVIKLLVKLSQGGVKTSNLHFVDSTGNVTEAYKELDAAIKTISEKKPESITIRQNGGCTKASVYLWRNCEVFHRFEISAITTSGIPYESLALGIQLLAGKHSVRKLFSYEDRELEFRYYQPHQLRLR